MPTISRPPCCSRPTTKILLAPAMNSAMWANKATQRNLTAPAQRMASSTVGPNAGEMAESGEAGLGRMAEPLEIVAAVEKLLDDRSADEDKPLAGKRIVITAGPTHEPIDPVRYIANRSSGKQGYAIARAAADGRRERDAGIGPGHAARSARREDRAGRKRARHAGGRRGRAAGRCRHLRRGGRGLAHRASRRTETEEGRQRPAEARAGRKPRHPRDRLRS